MEKLFWKKTRGNQDPKTELGPINETPKLHGCIVLFPAAFASM